MSLLDEQPFAPVRRMEDGWAVSARPACSDMDALRARGDDERAAAMDQFVSDPSQIGAWMASHPG
jgi:hypothetical protein